MDNIKYIVRIDENKIHQDDLDYLFMKTTCSRVFYGHLVNRSGSHFYFEIGPENDLVIIPHSWIKWMAPARKDFKEEKKYGTNCNS